LRMTAYRCFLPDLAGFTGPQRTGPAFGCVSETANCPNRLTGSSAPAAVFQFTIFTVPWHCIDGSEDFTPFTPMPVRILLCTA